MRLSWIFQGVEYTLDEGARYHQGNSGFGMAPIERFESRGPFQHGSTDEGYRLMPRILNLALAVAADSYEQLYVERSTLLSVFKPTNIAGTLRWSFGGKIRDIDCHVIDGMFFNTEDRAGLFQRFGVVLKANDPTWYDPAAKSYTILMDQEIEGTPVPTDIPMVVGASSINTNLIINYEGTAPSYPHVIRIEGPITNPIIENTSTAESLDFTGIQLAAGEFILMDLRFEKKTVIDQNGANRIADLTSTSDFSTFSIQPAPKAAAGVNTLKVSGLGTSSLTNINIVFYNRFVGI